MTPSPQLNVTISGGGRLWRLGMEALLAHRPGIGRVQHADSPSEIGGTADIFLLPAAAADTQLPELHTAHPRTPVVIIAPTDDLPRLARWIEQGALGIVDENAGLPDLLAAIRQASGGELSMPPALAVRLVQAMSAKKTAATPAEPLSPRELDVLAFLAQGLSNKAIAQQMYVSVRTVEGHLANIYGKLGVHSRTEAALIAINNGWVTPPSNT